LQIYSDSQEIEQNIRNARQLGTDATAIAPLITRLSGTIEEIDMDSMIKAKLYSQINNVGIIPVGNNGAAMAANVKLPIMQAYNLGYIVDADLESPHGTGPAVAIGTLTQAQFSHNTHNGVNLHDGLGNSMKAYILWKLSDKYKLLSLINLCLEYNDAITVLEGNPVDAANLLILKNKLKEAKSFGYITDATLTHLGTRIDLDAAAIAYTVDYRPNIKAQVDTRLLDWFRKALTIAKKLNYIDGADMTNTNIQADPIDTTAITYANYVQAGPVRTIQQNVQLKLQFTPA
jgi:hypothetical protein